MKELNEKGDAIDELKEKWKRKQSSKHIQTQNEWTKLSVSCVLYTFIFDDWKKGFCV